MIDNKKYGLPSLKKYPMPDAAHVRSAIRFFNYVDPAHEKELAAAILKRMDEYNLDFEDFDVGPENRFKKYIPKDELYHHGIKGQKWGVRRFQNEDGSLTKAGIERYRESWTSKDAKAVNNIHRTLSDDDKRKLNGGDTPKDFTTQEEYNHALGSFILKYGKTPVSAFDIWSEADSSGKYADEAAVSVLTRSGDKYRNKGYASKAVAKGMEWLDNNPDITTVYWDVRKDNAASIALAKKFGFTQMEGINPTNPDWTTYRKQYNRK